MPSRHCTACGTDGPPKTYHPSSFRVEVALWALAITVGLGAGFVSMVRGAADHAGPRELQAFAISSVRAADAVPAEAAPAEPAPRPSSVVAGVIEWVLGAVLDFVRSFWWVLPIPVAFSVWRQFATHPGCLACGSRNLVPIEYD